MKNRPYPYFFYGSEKPKSYRIRAIWNTCGSIRYQILSLVIQNSLTVKVSKCTYCAVMEQFSEVMALKKPSSWGQLLRDLNDTSKRNMENFCLLNFFKSSARRDFLKLSNVVVV